MEANLLVAAFAGFIGAIILTALIYLLKAGGQNLDIPFLIGSGFIDIQNKVRVYVIGIILHLIIGAAWGVLYVILLQGMALTPNWPAGILWGLAHGIFVGVMMGIIGNSHPYIGVGKPIKNPGIMGRKWGTLMPYWMLGLHIIYGACTLGIYYRLIN